jgi:hypothetical protein
MRLIKPEMPNPPRVHIKNKEILDEVFGDDPKPELPEKLRRDKVFLMKHLDAKISVVIYNQNKLYDCVEWLMRRTDNESK